MSQAGAQTVMLNLNGSHTGGLEGIPKLVVFINKCDEQQDAEMLELVEMELRELLEHYKFDAHTVWLSNLSSRVCETLSFRPPNLKFSEKLMWCEDLGNSEIGRGDRPQLAIPILRGVSILGFLLLTCVLDLSTQLSMCSAEVWERGPQSKTGSLETPWVVGGFLIFQCQLNAFPVECLPSVPPISPVVPQTPFIHGSALQALQGDPKWEAKLQELVDALVHTIALCWSPTPPPPRSMGRQGKGISNPGGGVGSELLWCTPQHRRLWGPEMAIFKGNLAGLADTGTRS